MPSDLLSIFLVPFIYSIPSTDCRRRLAVETELTDGGDSIPPNTACIVVSAPDPRDLLRGWQKTGPHESVSSLAFACILFRSG